MAGRRFERHAEAVWITFFVDILSTEEKKVNIMIPTQSKWDAIRPLVKKIEDGERLWK